MIYLITVNYNTGSYTIEFLNSLRAVKTDFRLIIVDNCSKTEDYNLLKDFIRKPEESNRITESVELFTKDAGWQMLLIRSEVNGGWSAGNNIGIRLAMEQPDFDSIALINNDTEVEPSFLDEILSFRKSNASADLIGCRILYANPSNVIWFDGGQYHKHSCRANHIHENKTLDEVGSSKEPRQTGFITGCFTYISKKCLDKIGLLDEDLFMYNEDLEYCIRAHKKGLKLYHVPSAVIWHKIIPTSSVFATYWGARNKFRVARKHSNVFDRVYMVLLYVVARIPRFLNWLTKGRTDLIKAQTKGMFDGLFKK